MGVAAMSLFLSTALGAPAGLDYPQTRKGEVVDDFFGRKVADPYRWLEDDNSVETKAWVTAQNRVTFGFLEAIPERKRLTDRITKLWDFEKYDTPFKRGNRYFYSYNTGLQNQSVLYVTTSPSERGAVLLDPNTLSKDGTIALAQVQVTDDGRLMAYALSEAGSDWQTWKVREVATGKDRPDELKWSKASGAAWLKDNSGFFYSRFDAPNKGETLKGVNQFHKVYFHKLGTPQAKDELIYERQDQPEWYLGAAVSDDGRWLILDGSKGTNPETSVFLKDLAKPGAKVEPFLVKMDATYVVVDNDADTFFVYTNLDAPRFRLVAVPRGKPDPADWQELIPEGPGKEVLDGVALVGERFVASWMKDAHTAISFHDLTGRRVGELALPALGTALGFGGKRSDTETFYTFASFAYPSTVYRYDFAKGESSVFRAPKVDFDPTAFEVEQVFYASKDRTQVPMFIVHKRGLVLDGNNPTLLYGYGGFNISETPYFSASRVAWMELGGVFALANIRGGGEYGMDWYNAGRLDKKQNGFDDFVAAAEWLIAHKLTSTPRLAIIGGSNGGLLVGACLTQRPDLFGAAVPIVGVMDMLRFHKFTLGWGWKSDYGSSETKAGFDVLMKYSPLHNIKPGTRYPATLVVTGDHDDRVVPAHSHKFTATLQAAQAGDAAILSRIETDAGHGAGKPTAKIIQEQADIYAFLVKALGVKLARGLPW
jgi:prolyl oligopeptidase